MAIANNSYADPQFCAQTLCSMLIQNCPKDKMNLVQTIGFDVAPNGEWRIFIGGDALLAYAKAPYAAYTNEPHKGMTLHYRKVYPGQELTHWIDKTIEQFVRLANSN